MTKRLLPGKYLPVWAAVSAVIIVLGIVIGALFGYNYVSADLKTVEISYDAVVTIEEKEETLSGLCEDVFKAEGLSFSAKRVSTEYDTSYISPTGNSFLTYEFGGKTDSASLEKAVAGIKEKIGAAAEFANSDIAVTAHTLAGEQFAEPVWRGAVALLVAAIVVLVYVGFRYGVACAVAGLCGCVSDVCVTGALLALTRIPVYAYTPTLFGGIALVFSLILWLARCAKMKEDFIDPAYASLPAQEAVAQSVLSSFKYVLLFVLPIAAVLVVVGAVASAGLRLVMLPALIPLAVSVYSSTLLAPAVVVPIKTATDKFKIKRKRYVGKKKAESAEE